MSLKDQVYCIPVNAARQCATCKNHIKGTWTCKAFPNWIPGEITKGKFDHTESYPGDNGIRYDPKDPLNPVSAPFAKNKKNAAT